MTRVEGPPVDVTRHGGETHDDDEGRVPQRRRRRWPVRIALGLLAAYVAWALFGAWSRFGQFDPELGSAAREYAGNQLSPAEYPWYFPTLTLHVMTASVALALVFFQMWPWLRRTHPLVHRSVGRIYIFAGVYPAVISALVVQVFWPFSVATMFSQVVPLLLWFSVTTYGYVLRRRGHVEEHRRWMLRSFGLTCLVLVELAIDPLIQLAIYTQFHTRLESNRDIYLQVKDSTENWVGLMLVILVVEGFLEYERIRSARRQPSAASRESTVR